MSSRTATKIEARSTKAQSINIEDEIREALRGR